MTDITEALNNLEIKSIKDTGDNYIVAHAEEGGEGLFTELAKTSLTPEMQAKADEWLAIEGNEVTVGY